MEGNFREIKGNFKINSEVKELLSIPIKKIGIQAPMGSRLKYTIDNESIELKIGETGILQFIIDNSFSHFYFLQDTEAIIDYVID